MSRGLNQSKKAGLSGLFLYGLWAAALLVTLTRAVVAEPLAIEVVGAEVAYDQRTSEPVVSFNMSLESARALARLTQQNVGRKFAIRVDRKTLSAPVIREPILGGSGQISGHFTEQQAGDLAAGFPRMSPKSNSKL